MKNKPLIQIQNLEKEFVMGNHNVKALRGVSFEVFPGEIISITSPSGSGKSTLLGLLGGLDTPTSGTITIDGIEISQLNERALTQVRNQKIGFVFQFFNLIPSLTALENVALPSHFAHKRRFKPEDRARELLVQLEMGDRTHHRPAQLSGGQQQRVAIARSLANNPPILLADEPTGNLDTEARRLVMDSLQRVNQLFGTTVIIVTHDNDIARQTNRILNLVDGLITSDQTE